jgi:hypothetical protein
MKKLVLLGAFCCTCLALAGCGEGGSTKKLQSDQIRKPDPANQVSAPGDKFRNPGSSTNVPNEPPPKN